MSKCFSFRFLPFFLLFFSVKTTVFSQKENLNIKVYKNKIVKDYYSFQKTENEELLDSILRYVNFYKYEIKEDSINSKILYLKGVRNIFLQRYNNADEYFLKSYNLAKKTNDKLLLGTIFNSRGLVASTSNKNYNQAENFYKEALKYYKEINELPQQIDTYYNLTVNSRNKKNWFESNKYAFSYLNLFSVYNKKKTGLKRLYYFIADNFLKLKDYDNSLKYLVKAKETDSPYTTYSFTTSLIDKNFAKIYEEKDSLNLAIKHYKCVAENLQEANKKNEFRIQESYTRALELENDLKEKSYLIIKDQKEQLFWSIFLIILLASLIFLLFIFWKRNNIKSKKIKELNSELNELIIDLKTKNKELKKNKKENENLLKLNEEALFSRVRRISIFNDAIRKISQDIETHISKDKKGSSYILTIQKKLEEITSEEELWEDFKVQFEKTRPSFFEKLKKLAPNLSINDLKHCTYIVSNLKSKEVALLTNVSPRSVETARYRIKKKMNLNKDQNLYDILNSL